MILKGREISTDTSWRAGRFDASAGPKQVLFGRMYEDFEIERSAFPAGSRVFAIASAGCTAIRLSEDHEVTAVDINPIQLAYAQRRALGAPVETGSAERMMQSGRRGFPLIGWTHKTLDTFFSLEDTDQQTMFWQKNLDTWRFRLAFDAATSRAVLRLTYAPNLLAMMPKHIGPVLRARMERCWSLHPNATNPYARSLFLDEADVDLVADSSLAHASKVHFACADAVSYLEGCAAGSFDAFTISNILDGATAVYCHRLFAALKRAASQNAVVVIRSFAESDAPSPTNYAARDRSILWGIVAVTEVAAL
jgi:S-adenosylmethionine:diacylglycerol 3-amino-3-carboxypropyl transferase